VAERLRHPSSELLLLNLTGGRRWQRRWARIDFDDAAKAERAVG
jgi:hypothetical protein